MIVDESSALLAALDRRLQVNGVLAFDADTPHPDAARASLVASSESDTAVPARGAAVAASLASDEADGATSLAERLPLGRVVSARVIDVPDAGHVVAEIERLRLTLTLPDGAAPASPGDRMVLRVLAHAPVLLLQNVDTTSIDRVRDDGRAQWSRDAMALARQTLDDGGTRTFTKPILDFGPAATAPWASSALALESASAAASASVGASASSPDATTIVDIAARDPSTLPAPATAVVLQGPAWPGQPMELVVRRERADEAFDNAALDQWCGEFVIDLPALGRVVGHLAWSMQGLRIRLEGEDEAGTSSMIGATPELAAALSDVALPVVALSVGRPAFDGSSSRRG